MADFIIKAFAELAHELVGFYTHLYAVNDL